MDDDKLDFLAEQPAQVEDPRAAETPAPDPQPQTSGGPARGPDGKFAARDAPQDTPSSPEGGGGHVPISAMLDEREKRQALERQLAAIQAQQAPPPPLEPTEQLHAALYAQNLKVSRKFADRQYGAQLVARVHDWAAGRCDEDPHFNHQMRSSEDPYEAAMQAYNREQILQTVRPSDLDAFRAWQAAQGRHPTSISSTAVPTQAIPRSLATAPGNGAAGKLHTPVGEGEAYRAVIPR